MIERVKTYFVKAVTVADEARKIVHDLLWAIIVVVSISATIFGAYTLFNNILI